MREITIMPLEMADFANLLEPPEDVALREAVAAERAIREAANDNSDRALAELKGVLDRSAIAIQAYVRSLRYHWTALGDTLERGQADGLLTSTMLHGFVKMLAAHDKSSADAHDRILTSIKASLRSVRARVPSIDSVGTPFVSAYDLAYQEDKEQRLSLRNRVTLLARRPPAVVNRATATIEAYKTALRSVFPFARVSSQSAFTLGDIEYRIFIEVPPALLDNPVELWRMEALVHAHVDAIDPRSAGRVMLEYKPLGHHAR